MARGFTGKEEWKMGISDHVAEYILKLLQEADGIAEIQRNELASFIGCVPSQINYVISSRFTPEQGYIVESRRGGGGYIRIIRRHTSAAGTALHIINSIGEQLDVATARAMLENMVYNEALSVMEGRILAAGISEQTLASVPKEQRDCLRASIFKNILLAMRSQS